MNLFSAVGALFQTQEDAYSGLGMSIQANDEVETKDHALWVLAIVYITPMALASLGYLWAQLRRPNPGNALLPLAVFFLMNSVSDAMFVESLYGKPEFKQQRNLGLAGLIAAVVLNLIQVAVSLGLELTHNPEWKPFLLRHPGMVMLIFLLSGTHAGSALLLSSQIMDVGCFSGPMTEATVGRLRVVGLLGILAHDAPLMLAQLWYGDEAPGRLTNTAIVAFAWSCAAVIMRIAQAVFARKMASIPEPRANPSLDLEAARQRDL